MADQATLAAGDRLLAIADVSIGSLAELRMALRAAGAHVDVDIAYSRDGVGHNSRVAVQPHPLEAIPNQEIFYGVIERDGVGLRTISTRPTDAPIRGAIMFVQGIACESIDYGSGFDQPMAQLLLGWARAGYATLRIDKRGLGDSEGCACNQLDFDTEFEDVSAAFSLLAGEARAAQIPLFLFGHSVGGMMAAELAADTEIDGAMVFGTSTAKWVDCIVATTERQLRMRGAAEEVVAERIAELRNGVISSGLNGRSPAYHAQLDQLDLGAAWRRARIAHALVLRGEHDWVVSPEEQARIADILGPERSKVVDLPGLDHVLGWHDSLAQSMTNYGGGRVDTAMVDVTLEWMRTVPVD